MGYGDELKSMEHSITDELRRVGTELKMLDITNAYIGKRILMEQLHETCPNLVELRIGGSNRITTKNNITFLKTKLGRVCNESRYWGSLIFAPIFRGDHRDCRWVVSWAGAAGDYCLSTMTLSGCYQVYQESRW
jgi:hypothetical protein